MIGIGIGLGLSSYRVPIGNSQFNPTQIAGLQLWLDGSDLTTLYQSSGGSLAAADGDPVGYWLDKSGNGRHVTQSSGVNKPTVRLNVKNSLPIVRFASSHFLSLASTLSLTNFSMYWVFRRSTSGVKSVPGGMQASWVYPFNWYLDNVTYGSFTGGAGPTLKTADTSTGYFILSSSKTGTGSTAYKVKRNDELFYSSDVIGGQTINTIGRANADYTNSDFLEFLIFDTEISSGSERAVLGYLNAKWGIY